MGEESVDAIRAQFTGTLASGRGWGWTTSYRRGVTPTVDMAVLGSARPIPDEDGAITGAAPSSPT